MKTRIEIKSWFSGAVLFEYESEDNTIKKTLENAVLRNADLRNADLRNADLSGAVLTPIKNDLFVVLLHGFAEIKNLKKALIDGKVDGSTYDGECSCLSGTLHAGVIKNNGPQEEKRKGIVLACRDASRPIEKFFLGIKPGDTPENNPVSKLVTEWIAEFEMMVGQTF